MARRTSHSAGGAGRFEFDRYQPGGADWRVTTDDGRVDLRFVPAGARREKLNAWVIASNFRQFVGTFQGTVADESGKKNPPRKRVTGGIDGRSLCPVVNRA